MIQRQIAYLAVQACVRAGLVLAAEIYQTVQGLEGVCTPGLDHSGRRTGYDGTAADTVSVYRVGGLHIPLAEKHESGSELLIFNKGIFHKTQSVILDERHPDDIPA